MSTVAFLDAFSKGSSSVGLPAIKALLARDVDVNAQDPDTFRTAFHHAAENGDAESLTLLLQDRRAACDLADRSGVRPITLAVERGHSGIVKTLVNNGASLTSIAPNEGTTLLHKACWMGHEYMVNYLLDTGAFKGELLDHKDTWGRTALHFAAFRGSVAVCKRLVDEGASGVMEADNWGNRPSMLAETLKPNNRDYLIQCEAAFDAVLFGVKLKAKVAKGGRAEQTGGATYE